MKDNSYDPNSIVQMDPLDHIRQRPSMYLGDVYNPTKLLIECLDNALDEVQATHADKILVSIDKDGSFTVADNGRGIPFDPKASLQEDKPILICNSIFTSGKFKKDQSDSAYNVAIGLHGVGLTAVRALSKTMSIDVVRKNIKANYKFHGHNSVDREFITKTENDKWSTLIKAYPDKKYFESLDMDFETIKERLIIASANFAKLNIEFNYKGKLIEIKGNEIELVSNYLGKDVNKWYTFDIDYTRKLEDGGKCKESCKVIFGWDFDSDVTKTKEFTTINLGSVKGGIHVTKLQNSIKSIFTKIKKSDYEFDENDTLCKFRCYINLKLVDPHFESQSKEKLSRKSKLEIMDELDNEIEKYFKKNKDESSELMKKFDEYHRSLQNKKLENKSKKRGSTEFTKLRDCKSRDGELIIGEGDSAIGGLVKMRDTNIHALLPLRGVPPNAADMKIQKLIENVEVSDIIKAVGVGIDPHCEIDNIRYNKIILTADADPAGHFINVLLIGLFVKLMPDVIKKGYLYVCEPPLYGYGYDDKFIPLWTEKDLSDAKKSGKTIRRFKGLGEYSNIELKKFILNSKERKLIQLEWYDDVNKLLELLSSEVERRKLALGEWSL